MASNLKIQQFIHRLEEGNLGNVVKLITMMIIGLAVLIVVVFDPFYWYFFRGLSHGKGMEQAQIARAIAAGEGYTTKSIRPLAVAQIEGFLEDKPEINTKEEVARRLQYDTYHAPLWSYTLAPAMKLMKNQWEFNPKRAVYALDKTVAVVSILLFYAALAVNFMTLRRLFDIKLALIATVVQLVTYLFWQYAMSGLPHMLLLFFFSVLCYCLVRAIEAEGEKRSALLWVIPIALLFGLMGLTNPVTLWMVPGALIFILFYFRARVVYAVVLVAVVLAMMAPWLIRNAQLTGNPVGVAGYSLLHDVTGSESQVMRNTEIDNVSANPARFRHKVQIQLVEQVLQITEKMGGVIAPIFFITLFYLFRRPVLRDLRWALLLMWLGAWGGMALFMAEDVATSISATSIHILFVPLFVGYGLAFIMTLWGGLNLHASYLRKALIVFLVVLSAAPLISAFLRQNVSIMWPPYAPPSMTYLSRWTEKDEVILSDMPWAVAWYSDRKGLWLPSSIAAFIDYYDYGQIGSPFGGMFLTPVTGNSAFLSEIVKGEYKEWAPLILRSTNVKNFPFTKAIPFGPEGFCIFYSNYERWSRNEASALKEMAEKEERSREAQEARGKTKKPGKTDETKDEAPEE